MLTYDRRIPLPELDKRIEVRYYFYPFPSCFDCLFGSYTFLRVACQKVISPRAHSFPSLSCKTSSQPSPTGEFSSLGPPRHESLNNEISLLLYNLWQNNKLKLNSARSILDSTVSCDVTTLPQTHAVNWARGNAWGLGWPAHTFPFIFCRWLMLRWSEM